ncbi:chemotaxis protein CheB [Saccharospirillum salsuginis]|uniref:protein-glutamate methylesterase n=1 Tax=Saccharospirillum salsuginis TaxID=418750 RepID=A0A918K4N1_9GAMM|nr:chemotaxis protein CheB [Saccharospirillum salsuginis]GGX44319.1 protein-glutamate methylesterase [Saccharospirillum salsuginis]
MDTRPATDQHNRVGLIADTPLVQHMLHQVVADAGYEVAVNTSPERLNATLLDSETIRVWVVELENHDTWDTFLNDLLERVEAPILFGDGDIPGKNDERYPRWHKRMQDKLRALAPVVEPKVDAPEIDLERLLKTTPRPVYTLPDRLKSAPKTELGPIWVLCASLGGPEAVKTFLDLLPRDLPACFLYAQHIDAGCLDALIQSIGRHTELKLVPGGHGSQLENGRVHVVPVNHEIRFTENHGIVWQNNPWSGPYGPSHDHLLKNVVTRFGSDTNAIVFSGMGSDGAIGATEVESAGGTVWAQDHVSCVQSSMPDSADRTGAVAWRGSPEAMAEKLIAWLDSHSTQVA